MTRLEIGPGLDGTRNEEEVLTTSSVLIAKLDEYYPLTLPGLSEHLDPITNADLP